MDQRGFEMVRQWGVGACFGAVGAEAAGRSFGDDDGMGWPCGWVRYDFVPDRGGARREPRPWPGMCRAGLSPRHFGGCGGSSVDVFGSRRDRGGRAADAYRLP